MNTSNTWVNTLRLSGTARARDWVTAAFSGSFLFGGIRLDMPFALANLDNAKPC